MIRDYRDTEAIDHLKIFLKGFGHELTKGGDPGVFCTCCEYYFCYINGTVYYGKMGNIWDAYDKTSCNDLIIKEII